MRRRSAWSARCSAARSSPAAWRASASGVRRALIVPGLGALDGLLGALLGAALALGVVWIVAAVVAQAPSESSLRADIQRSAILRELTSLLPPSGPILNALARLDPLPSIAGPSPDVAAPPPRIARAPGVRRRRAASCACSAPPAAWRSRAPAGSPRRTWSSPTPTWSPASATRPCRCGGRSPSLPARPVAFDPVDDVAVLSVPGLGRPAAVARARPAGRARRRDPRLSARTAPSTCARRASGARRSC